MGLHEETTIQQVVGRKSPMKEYSNSNKKNPSVEKQQDIVDRQRPSFPRPIKFSKAVSKYLNRIETPNG